MNHTEGGWPKDINPAEADQTMRFRWITIFSHYFHFLRQHASDPKSPTDGSDGGRHFLSLLFKTRQV